LTLNHTNDDNHSSLFRTIVTNQFNHEYKNITIHHNTPTQDNKKGGKTQKDTEAETALPVFGIIYFQQSFPLTNATFTCISLSPIELRMITTITKPATKQTIEAELSSGWITGNGVW
jgi:hypothetical protein